VVKKPAIDGDQFSATLSRNSALRGCRAEDKFVTDRRPSGFVLMLFDRPNFFPDKELKFAP